MARAEPERLVQPDRADVVGDGMEEPDRLLSLLGYRLYRGIMGHVDGRSPGEVAFGARFAETAYRDAEERRARR